VAERSKAWVCGQYLAGVVGFNPAGGGHGCLCCVCCGEKDKRQSQDNQDKEVQVKYRVRCETGQG
jgi:hypothetical protein